MVAVSRFGSSFVLSQLCGLRTRRAKSLEDSLSPHPPTTLSPCVRAVVGRFAGDDDVVGVALAQPGGSDLHEARLALQDRDVRGADVPHRRAQTADKLVDEIT